MTPCAREIKSTIVSNEATLPAKGEGERLRYGNFCQYGDYLNVCKSGNLNDNSSLRYSQSFAWPLVQLAVSCITDAYGKYHSCARRLKISELETSCHVPLRVLVIAVAGSQGFADSRTNLRSTSSSPKYILVWYTRVVCGVC
jgi:hypothetical protein